MQEMLPKRLISICIITPGLSGLYKLWKSTNKFIMNYLMLSCYLFCKDVYKNTPYL